MEGIEMSKEANTLIENLTKKKKIIETLKLNGDRLTKIVSLSYIIQSISDSCNGWFVSMQNPNVVNIFTEEEMDKFLAFYKDIALQLTDKDLEIVNSLGDYLKEYFKSQKKDDESKSMIV